MTETYEVIGRLTEIADAKRNMVSRIQKYTIANNMKSVDFENKDKQDYVKYEEGLFIKNVTSLTLEILGVTIFHIFSTKDKKLDTHQHSLQSQTITVKKGKLFDDETGHMYIVGESMFISKKHNHKIKYFADSEYIVYFAPNLIGE